MTKKSLDRKAAKQFIVSNRDNGKTDQEIYHELTEQYFDKKSIALLIHETITKENKNKYRIYNNILIGILILLALYKLLVVFYLTKESGELWVLLFALFIPLLSFYVIYEIWNYNKPIYKFCGIMSGLSFLQNMRKIETKEELLFNVVVIGTIVALSFFLDYKMFPNYNP